MTLASIAYRITENWKVSPHAWPYLKAMYSLQSVDDKYGMDDGRTIVLYFLANAGTWRGPVAREIKAELKALLASK